MSAPINHLLIHLLILDLKQSKRGVPDIDPRTEPPPRYISPIAATPEEEENSTQSPINHHLSLTTVSPTLPPSGLLGNYTTITPRVPFIVERHPVSKEGNLLPPMTFLRE